MTTNNYNAVKVDDDSRRYLFCESSGVYRKNVQFFNSLSEDIVDNSKALRVIAEYLLKFDVKGIIPTGNFQNHIPQESNDIMNTIKEYNKDKILLFIEDCKELKYNEYISSTTMFQLWNTWIQKQKIDIKYDKIQFSTRLGLVIKKNKLDFITKARDSTKRGYDIDIDKIKKWASKFVEDDDVEDDDVD
jgi:hypothetical protein